MLIVHLFISYAQVNLCPVPCFSSSWYRDLAAASACGSSWTFLFTFIVGPGRCASRAFVCLFCMRYLFPFSLSHCVMGWLQLVIEAFHGLFN